MGLDTISWQRIKSILDLRAIWGKLANGPTQSQPLWHDIQSLARCYWALNLDESDLQNAYI